MRTKIKQIQNSDIGKTICVKGWLRSVRTSKNLTFLALNDGSQLNSLQVIADASTNSYESMIPQLTTGTALCIQGTVVESPGKEQAFELKAETISIIGPCDAERYPLQKKRHSVEFLRSIAHLRPRTNMQGAVTRVRNALAWATHKFFQEQGFLYIQTPILTPSDCEGAGSMFTVTTLDLTDPHKNENGSVDFSQDFFGRQAFLTVSGQLEGESFACALSDIYTFGPTFRAENSNTSRHLAEFWMIEPEIAFADLQDDMDCAEQYLKYCIRYVLEHCADDLQLCNTFIKKGLIDSLEFIVKTPSVRLSYTKAVSILKASGKKFEFPVTWGSDLQTEHERYLTEQHCKAPVMVFDYPIEIKSFYMRVNSDHKTVAAMDMLVPGVGELIGGSQREERLDILDKRMKACNLNLDDYWWYRELRMYGSVPHAGFGLGFERLVQFVTGIENIRDVIPFPRYPKHLEF